MLKGVISGGNSPALGPVAEELGVLTIFVDGCTDFLWDKAVPNPTFAFRTTNIQSADGVTCAVAAAQTWPTAKKIAPIHPDYCYGRNAFDHFMIAYKKMVPGAEVVSEGWPKLGTTDFTAHITKTMSSSPDLIMSSVWGGDYVALYKQALRYGMFNNAKFASTIAFGVAPHAIGKDHPEGVIAGVHSNYYFTFPPGNRWPANKTFVEKYFKRWNEHPNFQSDGAYHTLHMYRTAIEKANRLPGGRFGGPRQTSRGPWLWRRTSTPRLLMRHSALAASLLCVGAPAAQAGHEVSYSPSFYPQEIRIEPLDPDAAARAFGNARDPLHAYLGAAPRFAADIPSHLKSVVSLRSLIAARINPGSDRLASRDARCRVLAAAAPLLATAPDVVAHAYPITPYHADYLDHVDRVLDRGRGPAQEPEVSPLHVRPESS